MDINFELYKVFYYIAKEGSITAAAEKLFISQPAVTQSLKKLEEELGGPLFIRKKSGVMLTSEGEKLYEYIENSIHVLNNASNLFSQYLNSDIGRVRVNVAGSWGMILLPEIINRFRIKYPNVEVSITVEKTSDAIKKITNSDIDIGIFEGNIGAYKDVVEIMNLATIPYSFFTTKEYLDKVGPVDVNHLEKYDFYLPKADSNRMAMLNASLEKAGLKINSTKHVAGTEMTKKIIEKGLGIGFFNEIIVKDSPEFVKVDLGIGSIEGVLTFAVKNKKLLSNACLNFLQLMEEVVKEVIINERMIQ